MLKTPRRSEIVILMVPDSPHVETAVLGENEVVGGIRRDHIIVVMSTVEPLYIKQLYGRMGRIKEKPRLMRNRLVHHSNAIVKGGDKS